MIDNRELRIGNILQDRKGRLCKVEVLSANPEDTKILAIKGGVTSLPVQPIPLSEELLLKCGLNFRNGYGYSVTGFEGGIFKSVKSGLYEVYRYHALRFEIKYLHQLQNLYYALTGEELEVSL